MEENDKWLVVGDESLFHAEHDADTILFVKKFFDHEQIEKEISLVVSGYKPRMGFEGTTNYVFVDLRKRGVINNGFNVVAMIKPKEKILDLVGLYPYLEGLPVEFKIKGKCFSPTGWEGNVAGELDDRNFVFYVPCLPAFEKSVQIDENVTFEMAVFLANAQKFETKELHISEGPVYEHAKAEFLKDHPDKSEDDFPYVAITTSQLRCIIEKSEDAWYEFVSPVTEVKEIEICGKQVFRLTIFYGVGGYEIPVYAYVRKEDCDGYVPVVSESVSGVGILIGYKHDCDSSTSE